jgi:diadenosine tetraphosphate (Ap4A) HIT family hydrolase
MVVQGVIEMTGECPFCSPEDEDIVVQNEFCCARWDKYPVTEGHMLVIPHRHAREIFELAREEWHSTLSLIKECKTVIESRTSPDGYNIGFNVGRYAGQSVMHCHCHVIPRYIGDVENPTGGIRAVIPEKELY